MCKGKDEGIVGNIFIALEREPLVATVIETISLSTTLYGWFP
jgi:hypothetical protein